MATDSHAISAPDLHSRRPGNRRKGYARAAVTRGEVVVGAVVLLLLIVLLSPYLLQRRSEARRLACEARQIQLAAALNAYSDLHQHYPGYRVNQLREAPADEQPVPGDEAATTPPSGKPIGWTFAVLPLLEPSPGSEADLPAYQMIHDAFGPSGPEDTAGKTPSVRIPTLNCPAGTDPIEPNQPTTSYIVNTGMPDAEPSEMAPADWPANGALQSAFPPSPYPLERVSRAYVVEHDGATNTLLVTENADSGLWVDHDEPLVGFVWIDALVDGVPARGNQLLAINEKTGQGDGSYPFARPSSRHPGGVNVVYCSGRSQFLSARIDYLAFTQLLTSNAADVKKPGALEPVAEPYRVSPDE